jgi:hypothetical protein
MGIDTAFKCALYLTATRVDDTCVIVRGRPGRRACEHGRLRFRIGSAYRRPGRHRRVYAWRDMLASASRQTNIVLTVRRSG